MEAPAIFSVNTHIHTHTQLYLCVEEHWIWGWFFPDTGSVYEYNTVCLFFSPDLKVL